MLGTLINFAAVLLGSAIGLLLGKKVPERLRDTVMQGLGLCVLIIGALSALETDDVLGMIICIVLGALLGEWINIERRLAALGTRAQALFVRGGADGDGSFVQAFMAASLLFCVGPMSIIGPLESGLAGSHATQIAKGMMDGVSSIFIAAALGPGALLSALVILVYQGLITLAAGLLSPLLTEPIITQMSAVGGVVIIGVGLNLLNATDIRSGNLLPAIFLPIAYVPLAQWLGTLL